MIDDAHLIFSINSTASNESVIINLPEKLAHKYPAVFALFYFHKHVNTGNDFQWYQFNSTFDLSFLWQDLLTKGRLPKLVYFPAEISMSFGSVLEFQAAQMLLNAALRQDVHVEISLEETNRSPAIVKIIENMLLKSDEKKSTIVQRVNANCTLERIHKTTRTASFNQLDDVLYLEPESTELFSFWMNDDAFFKNNENKESILFQAHQHNRLNAPIEIKSITNPIERHYLHTFVSMYDEVLVDRDFYSDEIDESSTVITELIKVYAHIKCSIPYPTDKLDDLIERCSDAPFAYWKAYLLAYGHILRAYNEGHTVLHEKNRFIQAFQLFKSLGDFTGMTRVYHAHASLLNKSGHYASAIRLMEICKKIRSSLQETYGVAKVHNGMAYAHLQNDNLSDALEHHLHAEELLIQVNQFEELAFTYCLISWVHFLSDDFPEAVNYCRKSIQTMTEHNLQALAFRTKPDLHAQLGLCLFYNEDYSEALEQSDFCEAHTVDSSATGEIERTLLRSLINEHRGDRHLADLSFDYVPELIQDNADVDVHIEALYYRIAINRMVTDQDKWKRDNLVIKAIEFCEHHRLTNTISWFKEN